MKKYGILFAILIFTLKGISQTPILERRITIKMTQQTVARVLDAIAETANFQFSYNPQVVGADRRITVMSENRTVKQVLDEIFKGTVSYQQMGKHLVLQKSLKAKSSAPQGIQKQEVKYPYIISGYIRDGYSGDGVRDAGVYEKEGQTAVLSGDFGYYQLKYTSKEQKIALKFTKQGFKDTTVWVNYEGKGVIDLHINLYPLVIPQEYAENEIEELKDSLAKNRAMDSWQSGEKDSLKNSGGLADTMEKMNLAWDPLNGKNIEETGVAKWLVGTYQKTLNTAIRDSFYRNWQITFFPPLGTNGVLSGRMTNKISVNMLAGYNGAVKGAEFTGMVGILRGNMEGAQFAGVGNLVGGEINGLQAGGIFNFNNKGGKGVQLSGIANTNALAFTGVQLSGILNQNAGKGRGVQIAGVINKARDLDGVQISGVINIARKVNGMQLGLINVADTVDGFMFGILNFVRNGLHQLEFSFNEAAFAGVSYRSGKSGIYSIVSLMTEYPVDFRNKWVAYGYGIGSDVKLLKPVYWTNELKVYHLTPHFKSDYLHLWGRLNSGIALKIFKGFSLMGAVSGNFQLSDSYDPDYYLGAEQIGNKAIWSGGDRFKWRVWTGWQLGIRLF